MLTVSTNTLCKNLSLSRQALYDRAAQEGWMQVKGRWLIESLPKDLQIRLMAGSGKPERPSKPILLKAATEKSREEARLRAALISLYQSMDMKVEEFVSAYNALEVSRPIHEKLGPVSVATFYRWLKAFREAGADGIVPKWGATPKGSSSLSDLEKSYLEHWYLSPERRTVSHCWRLLREALPSSRATYSACLRHLQSLPKPVVDFYRLGKRKFEALYQPYIDREPELYQPMEQVVSDHHNFDFLVIREGKIFRPWVTVFQDYRSSKILGFCPSIYPSSLSILVALYQMVVQYGVPDLLHVDNGKDYRSRILSGDTWKVRTVKEGGIEEEELVSIQGSCALLGMEVVFCRPYHGQSKGRTERTFGTFCEYFSKNTGTYVGSNTVSRPEDTALFYRKLHRQAKRTDLYRWEDFVLGLEAFVRWWNGNWRGTGKGMEGRTPDEVFASGSRPLKRVDPETIALALTKPYVRRVQKNGVRVAGIDYWAEELFRYARQEVLVRVSLANPEEAIIQDPKGRYLCTARADWFAETRDLAEDNRRVSEARNANLRFIRQYGEKLPSAPQIPFLPEASRELPLAAGAEHQNRSIEPTKKREQPALEGRIKTNLKNPLDL